MEQARVVLRPLANPMPLGFVGVTVATLVDSGISLKWYPLSEDHHAALVILVFALLTQVIACVFGYLTRDPIAATGMGVQAAGWAGNGLLLLLGQPGQTQAVLGTFLFGAAAGLLMVAFVAMESKAIPALVMGGTGVRWVFSGLYQTTATGTWQTISGILGLVVCAGAIYAALALELEDIRKRTILPVGRRGRARIVFHPDLAEQTSDAATEAGVRAQL